MTTDTDLDISDLDPAEVLAALYNGSRPQGMGFMQHVPGDLSVEKARELLKQNSYFDYLAGRVLKLNFGNLKQFRVDLYDRDLGHGKARRIIDDLRAKGIKTNSDTVVADALPGLMTLDQANKVHNLGRRDAIE